MQNTNRFARYSIVATAVLLVLALAFPETVLADYRGEGPWPGLGGCFQSRGSHCRYPCERTNQMGQGRRCCAGSPFRRCDGSEEIGQGGEWGSTWWSSNGSMRRQRELIF